MDNNKFKINIINKLLIQNIINLLKLINHKYKKYFNNQDLNNLICYFEKIKFKYLITKKKHKKKYNRNHKPQILNNINRCNARTWGSIKQDGTKLSYGNRCKMKKIKGSQYCFIHSKKLTHGNYFDPINNEIKNIFNKKRHN
tara:strand:- start:1192 stop:1617 length:426 start_codon:yes stop_codon:yes gene_type:complete